MQFQDGQLGERVAHLLAALPDERDGWSRALWLRFPNELLGDRFPLELWEWEQHPDVVIEAARVEFEQV